jgi:glucarate dehydratase
VRITRLESFDVGVPFEAPIVHAMGVSFPVRVRTVIRLHTDDGLTGVGECGPSPLARFTGRGTMQEEVAPLVVGADPFDRGPVLAAIGRRPEAVAVEIALWDLLGKALGLPVSRLLGAERPLAAVPHSCYVFFRAPNREGRGAVTPENYVEHWTAVMRAYGFQTLKCKLGGRDPMEEAECVEALRAAVGPRVKLRVDPNGAWSLGTALRVLRRLEPVDLEYAEEPLRYSAAQGTDTAALRRLRSSGRTPICADGVSDTMRLRQVVLDEAADVAMCDLFGCGGIQASRDWFQIAHAMRLSSTLHSGPELGVGQAARLHVAAAHPDLRHAIDGHYHHYVDDVLAGGKLRYEGGAMPVPEGPGLGVDLDDERLERWAYTPERQREWEAFWEETKRAQGVGPLYPEGRAHRW